LRSKFPGLDTRFLLSPLFQPCFFFGQALNLPSDIDADKIDAVCTDGVLTLTLVKGEKAKPVKVKVKSE
jgi:hypothetical protein